jgi:hypothetical protein
MRQHATASKAATSDRSASPSARETLGRKPSRGADRAAVTEARSGSQAGKLSCEPRQQTLLSETTIGHDFSRIPVFSTDAATRPAAGLAPGVVFHREKSVEMPGEEEQGVDGGTPAPKTPAPAGCDCVPSSVQIKNVSATRSGKLYGHKFDVEIALTYFAAASGPGTDAQLFWFEKSDRPPAWYGVGPNVWTDLFPLFPASPTFDGWTKSRTKPCPGSETATITDPPAASVDLPARTIDFDIYVRGQRISHNARAKQVLEPDGKGGVKTQTFTILPSALGPLAGP